MDKAEKVVQSLIEDYLRNNRAARRISAGMEKLGIGFSPIVDHITIRTRDVRKKAERFLNLGFEQDKSAGSGGILDYGDWFAIVLRKAGLPAVFIDQAKPGGAGKSSIIRPWVRKFTDRTLHHVAIRVDDIEKAVKSMKRSGIDFAGPIVGKRGSVLRQIFTKPQLKRGEPFTVLELAERHEGYLGFQPPQADRLMQSTRT